MKLKSKTREWLEVIICALVLTVFIKSTVMDVYKVPTGSMLPTIQLNSRLIGFKTPYLMNDALGIIPKRGEIITFHSRVENKTLVKRVIGLPGDTIDIKNGNIYINGEEYKEYAHGLTEAIGDEVSYPYKVKDNHVFVLGDNRENSADSRVFGAIPIQDITSQILFK